MKSFEIAVARVAQIYNIIYGRIQSENCFLITIPFPETYFQAVKYNDNAMTINAMYHACHNVTLHISIDGYSGNE